MAMAVVDRARFPIPGMGWLKSPGHQNCLRCHHDNHDGHHIINKIIMVIVIVVMDMMMMMIYTCESHGQA